MFPYLFSRTELKGRGILPAGRTRWLRKSPWNIWYILCLQDGVQPNSEKQKLKRKFYSKQSLKTTPGLDVVGLVSDSPILDAPVLSLKGNYHF